MSNRILLVEDEAHLQEVIKLNLEMEGNEVITADTGNDALKKFREQHFDLVILDVMLPGMDGYSVCEQIRLENLDMPIIFLTAKNTGEDRILGLRRGADDYLTKPFNLEELLLRVQNLLKRSAKTTASGESVNLYKFDDVQIDLQNYKAKKGDEEFPLTKKEVMLLKLLIDRKNEVVSRQQILTTVWGYDVFPNTRTIDNFIMNFRKYFEKDPKNPVHFHSVRGVGYIFKDN